MDKESIIQIPFEIELAGSVKGTNEPEKMVNKPNS